MIVCGYEWCVKFICRWYDVIIIILIFVIMYIILVMIVLLEDMVIKNRRVILKYFILYSVYCINLLIMLLKSWY